ncbi:hypothetical protein LH51_10310 [Nitrincola sp. A-D6]|uniref:hypothetical protein n=1 Tax=Nitrincola sp. A-D6 TaxID=1545442 RepID=UPI00051FF33C|nr:hypothetical protein [Nitrincola sp. A-D6]KGK42076.1 hypothetical protein LH51_10310 [Nitrincola sp. A-D6]
MESILLHLIFGQAQVCGRDGGITLMGPSAARTAAVERAMDGESVSHQSDTTIQRGTTLSSTTGEALNYPARHPK